MCLYVNRSFNCAFHNHLAWQSNYSNYPYSYHSPSLQANDDDDDVEQGRLLGVAAVGCTATRSRRVRAQSDAARASGNDAAAEGEHTGWDMLS